LLRPAAGRFAFLKKRYRRAIGKSGQRFGVRPRPELSGASLAFVVPATLAMRDAGA
jgi:hypothetical protein